MQKGCSKLGVVDGQTLRERKQCMEKEENLGVKIIDIKEPKLEKEVEQKSSKKKTQEKVCSRQAFTACSGTELIAFPRHLCGHKPSLSSPIIIASNSSATL